MKTWTCANQIERMTKPGLVRCRRAQILSKIDHCVIFQGHILSSPTSLPHRLSRLCLGPTTSISILLVCCICAQTALCSRSRNTSARCSQMLNFPDHTQCPIITLCVLFFWSLITANSAPHGLVGSSPTPS